MYVIYSVTRRQYTHTHEVASRASSRLRTPTAGSHKFNAWMIDDAIRLSFIDFSHASPGC
jgi:hypothetical protein